jgi:hypothetical protein
MVLSNGDGPSTSLLPHAFIPSRKFANLLRNDKIGAVMPAKSSVLKLISLMCASLLAVATLNATADSTYADAWGPGVGSTAPLLQGNNHSGITLGFADLKGPKGLLFVFNRSVDW